MGGETAKSLTEHIMVEKADLSLLDKESSNEFSEKLDRALTEHFRGLKLGKKPNYLYVSELYADKVVVNIHWAMENQDELRTPSTYYRLGYKRAPSGIFSFGAVEEVDRKTNWTPRVKIQKRLDDDFWKGAV